MSQQLKNLALLAYGGCNMPPLERAIKKAFMDQSIASAQLNPRFIVNNPSQQDFLLTTLQDNLNQCQTFFLSVAFITQDGLNTIKTQLADLAARHISGKILTSTYLGFNEPKAFVSLLKIPNVEVRISKKQGFHSKGYLFDMGDYQSFIIGSSNLTTAALKLNYEWNVQLTSYENGAMISTIQKHLAQEWAEAEPLTWAWVHEFEKNYKPIVQEHQLTPVVSESTNTTYATIQPNKMQVVALKKLAALRQSGARRGLVISATGTGKTYLAAFDVQQARPKRMLFIVHREQILMKAMASFKKVIGGPDSDYGILSGHSKTLNAKYLFATIQTVSKETYQTELGADAFDYILIDEVHKAGAQSYIKTIDFFKPKFLLGMTATPERTDEFNIFELFDYNVAYEIRLQDALAEDLLCPFYYFGVTDYEKDGQVIDETAQLAYLTNQERCRFLIQKIDYYGCSGNKPKGLVFCSRKEEAKQMAQLFQAQGIPSAYLSGEDSLEHRESVVAQLENGKIHYIFTVDIFNEGIDIPKVNQIVMLRNTESSIIFIQQLGRGLRKDRSKDFVTIIDFIGNYKNNYMIPMALSDDHSQNKNNLRRDTIDATYIQGLSAVNFERVAKDRIFKSIDQAPLKSMRLLKSSFKKLKMRLNRTPYLLDFQTYNGVDPLLFVDKVKTYYNFLDKMAVPQEPLTDAENDALAFIGTELLVGQRPHELALLKYVVTQKRFDLSMTEIEALYQKWQLPYTKASLRTILKVLDLSFYHAALRKKYAPIQLFEVTGTTLKGTEKLKTFMTNPYFVRLLLDLLDTGLAKAKTYDVAHPLNLYRKYRRKDALRLLNMDFKQNEQSIGGYTYSQHQFAVFVTLDKGQDFKGALLAYEDEFLDPATFKWFTKAPRTLASPEVKILQNPEDWQIHLFVKPNYRKKDTEIDFYYLGEMTPVDSTIEQLAKKTTAEQTTNVVTLNFKLQHPVAPNMYEFLVQNLRQTPASPTDPPFTNLP